MSVPKNGYISSLLIGSQASEGPASIALQSAIVFFVSFSFSVFNGRLLSLKMDESVSFKKSELAEFNSSKVRKEFKETGEIKKERN